jgi:hypothetical protein
MESHRTNLFKNKGKDQDVSDEKIILMSPFSA